jgi:hypothetical protein
MTTRDAEHWDVAGYALGVLDERSAARFEEHLAACPLCVDELESLLPTVALMSEVDGSSLEVIDQSPLPGRLISTVRLDRRRSMRRRVLAGAAATVLVGGAALVTGATLLPGLGQQATLDPGAITALPDADEHWSATDPASGVRADVVLERKLWGTQVWFALAPLEGPLTCQLLVVDRDGTVHTAASWWVPPEGYGTEARPAPLVLQAATAVAPDDIVRIEVQTIDRDGGTAELVTVPL